MFILDRLFIGGLTFVLDKLAAAAEQEMNDDTALHEELTAAQMRLELGEIDEEEFARVEREVLAALREIRKRRGEAVGPGELTVTGVEATVEGDESGRP